MGIEGHIEISLGWDGRRIVSAAVRSRRPQIAMRLLHGLSAAQAVQRVPLVFSICARAQEAAARAAVEAATGLAVDAAEHQRRSRRVLAESVHEALWRVFCDWPDWLGEARATKAIATMRQALVPLVKDEPGADAAAAVAACHRLLAEFVFGEPSADWQARLAAGTVGDWMGHGNTAAARLVAAAWKRPGAAAARLLPALPAAQLATALRAELADENFATQPLWQGEPAETGPLGRSGATLAALVAAHGVGLGVRLLARLADTLHLLGRLAGGSGATPVIDSARDADGAGWGIVDTARGRLIHVATLAGERVARYRIVAPTEWNFHPQGPLAGLLVGAPAASRAAAESLAALAVQALDPCVAQRVEVLDA